MLALHLTALIAAAGVPEQGFMRGMTISCPGYGQVWGASGMTKAITESKKLGVNWVAIHPYARVRQDGSVQGSEPSKTDYLIGAVKRAAAGKVKLFWKPHLAYWGSFEWRGSIAFKTESEWKRFFADYERWIVAHARFAQASNVGLFSVGLEYKATLHREADWRRVIKAVRKVYRGQLTYAANWDSVETVPFWDLLDAVGVQAYFPLTSETPGPKGYAKKFDSWLARSVAVSKRHKLGGVILTELGYPRSDNAAAKPWAPETDGSDSAIALRRQLMEVTLKRAEANPEVRGLFWWKWLPGWNPFQSDFSMKDPEAREVLQTHWASSKPPKRRGFDVARGSE